MLVKKTNNTLQEKRAGNIDEIMFKRTVLQQKEWYKLTVKKIIMNNTSIKYTCTYL